MKPIIKLSAIIVVAITFSSCSSGVVNQNSKELTKSNVQSVQEKAPVKIPATKEIVTALCSDEFQGRFTGSEGNVKAGEYISNIYKDIGLTPLFGDTFYEPYAQEVYKESGLIQKDEKPEKKLINNVVAVIKGRDSQKAVVISAHFDHLGYLNGQSRQLIRGALDNASGVSALIKIAYTLKEKSKEEPFGMDIVFCAFNGEEEGLQGSMAFVNEFKAKTLYNSVYNINIDCIGAKNGGANLALKNKSKISNKLYAAIKATLKKDSIGFEDKAVLGGSDQMSFERANIPNAFIIQENIKELVHKPTDTPDILDYGQIDKIANAISDFVETNDGVILSQ